MPSSRISRARSWAAATLALLPLSCPAAGMGAAFQETLDQVNAQCPGKYPSQVTAIPEPSQMAAVESSQLMAMLESWNPSLREAAAKELGSRDANIIASLRKGTHSPNWMVRAGSLSALAAITTGPDADQTRATAKGIAGDFIRLTKDPRLEVRTAALDGIAKIAPSGADAAMAVLALCNDSDPYLAQDAIIMFDKNFTIDSIPESDLIKTLTVAMRSPLPRGRGHAMRIIGRQLDKGAHKKFIPVLLDHLDWKPMRDTMFGSGGQEEALKMLTTMGVEELIPRIPALMGKDLRGPRLFIPSLDAAASFGRKAKPILPELRAILKDIEDNGKNAKIYPGRDTEIHLQKLRATIELIDKA